MGELPDQELTQSWTQLYRGVLRMRPVLEPPYADSDEGARVHDEFCRWLRAYLIRKGGADEECMARVEMETDVERENLHAVWSCLPSSVMRRGPLAGR